jgi:hypothetical protein
VVELRLCPASFAPNVSHSLDPVYGNQIRWRKAAYNTSVQLARCADSNAYLKVLTCPAIVSHDMPDVITNVNTEGRVWLNRQEGKASSATVCSQSGEVGARLDPVVRSTGPGVSGSHGARTMVNSACWQTRPRYERWAR